MLLGSARVLRGSTLSDVLAQAAAPCLPKLQYAFQVQYQYQCTVGTLRSITIRGRFCSACPYIGCTKRYIPGVTYIQILMYKIKIWHLQKLTRTKIYTHHTDLCSKFSITIVEITAEAFIDTSLVQT